MHYNQHSDAGSQMPIENAVTPGNVLQVDTSKIDRRVEVALKLLNEWKNHNHPLEDIAEHVRISNSHLRQLFRKNIGFSPAKYLKLIRLQSAKALIDDSYLLVKEVVAAVGYGDVSHFVRDFKAHFGLTPTEIRKKRRASTAKGGATLAIMSGPIVSWGKKNGLFPAAGHGNTARTQEEYGTPSPSRIPAPVMQHASASLDFGKLTTKNASSKAERSGMRARA